MGILTYFSACFYYLKFGLYSNPVNKTYHIASLMIVPAFVAVGITVVLVRPFFLIMIAKLYTDVILVNTEATIIKEDKKFDLSMLSFIVLLGTLLILYFLGEQLGVRGWIETIAEKDVSEYLKSIKGLYKIK